MPVNKGEYLHIPPCERCGPSVLNFALAYRFAAINLARAGIGLGKPQVYMSTLALLGCSHIGPKGLARRLGYILPLG